MTISQNKVVSLGYELRLNDAAGQFVEKADATNPLTFLYGAGAMLPAFEANLTNKKVGDKVAFGLKSADAYGEVNPQAIVELPISTFVINGKLATDMLKLGNVIPMRNADGHHIQGRIIAINDQSVRMDFNHAMAGKDLHFTVEIYNVRQATASELAHGHAHGPDGTHEHH